MTYFSNPKPSNSFKSFSNSNVFFNAGDRQPSSLGSPGPVKSCNSSSARRETFNGLGSNAEITCTSERKSFNSFSDMDHFAGFGLDSIPRRRSSTRSVTPSASPAVDDLSSKPTSKPSQANPVRRDLLSISDFLNSTRQELVSMPENNSSSSACNPDYISEVSRPKLSNSSPLASPSLSDPSRLSGTDEAMDILCDSQSDTSLSRKTTCSSSDDEDDSPSLISDYETPSSSVHSLNSSKASPPLNFANLEDSKSLLDLSSFSNSPSLQSEWDFDKLFGTGRWFGGVRLMPEDFEGACWMSEEPQTISTVDDEEEQRGRSVGTSFGLGSIKMRARKSKSRSPPPVTTPIASNETKPTPSPPTPDFTHQAAMAHFNSHQKTNIDPSAAMEQYKLRKERSKSRGKSRLRDFEIVGHEEEEEEERLEQMVHERLREIAGRKLKGVLNDFENGGSKSNERRDSWSSDNDDWEEGR